MTIRMLVAYADHEKAHEQDLRGMLKEIEDWRSDNERSGQHECS